ncbi:MAG: hypothetical protein U0K68_05575 [Agathobacter sp.]|nr:hypothetical protein [Agathobacter sp.]
MPDAKRKNYRFLGWYYKNGSKSVLAKDSMEIKKSIVLIAKWQKIKVKTISNFKKTKVLIKGQKAFKISWSKVKNASCYQYRSAWKKSGLKKAKVYTKYDAYVNYPRGDYYIEVRAGEKDSTGKMIYGKWKKYHVTK